MTLFRMLFAFILYILVNIYLFIRGWQALPNHTFVHITYSAAFIVASTAVFIAIFAGNKLPVWLSRTLETIGGYWIILFVFILMAAFLADIIRIVQHFFPIYPQWVTVHYAGVKLFYLGGTFILLILISIIGYYRFMHPRIHTMEIPVVKNDQRPDEIKLTVVSDIHLGNLVNKERFSKWAAMINKQNPDIILIAGDIFDHNMKIVEIQRMDEALSLLNARYGVFAIPGNHDYYAGIDHAVSYMKRSGIHVLKDQTVTIDHRFTIIGRDDVTNRNRKPLKALVSGLNANLPWIVLDHQPYALNESLQNRIDLHISGHTHDGQIFPINLIVARMYELGYGYRKKDDTHFYVSSGLGLWGAPIRFGTSSEIVNILLKVH